MCSLGVIYNNGKHKFIEIEHREYFKIEGYKFLQCKYCGIEEPLEQTTMQSQIHKHNWTNYRGIRNGKYHIRCCVYDCKSILTIKKQDILNSNRETNKIVYQKLPTILE